MPSRYKPWGYMPQPLPSDVPDHVLLWEAKRMSIPNETLQAMIRSYHGFALTDDELELVRPELDNYLKEVEKLGELDLASVLSSRLLRAQEGGKP